MNKNLQKSFPYSKDDLNNTIATVSFYIVSILKGVPSQHVLAYKKNYFMTLYPLYAIWEEYGFGELSEVCIDDSILPYYMAFKTMPEETLKAFIPGIQRENPFAPPFAPFENTTVLVKRMADMYQNLLDNLNNGNLYFA